MTEPKEGQAGGQPGAAGGTPPAPGSEGNLPPAPGGGQPGQGQVPPVAVELADDALVKLPGGETVKYGELKGGYMKDSDYRQKTAALAEKERAVDARAAVQPGQGAPAGYYPNAAAMQEEERTPEERLAAMEQREQTRVLSSGLSGMINALKEAYPDADPNTVYDICWANPNAQVEAVMKQDHERIQGAQKAVTFDAIQADPERKAAYDKQVIEKHEADKAVKAAGTGFATGDGSAAPAPPDPAKKPESFREIGKGLKAELAALEDQG